MDQQSSTNPVPVVEDSSSVIDSDSDTRQQIVSVINSKKNFLITVGKDPCVDDLASALGLTIVLNKLGKHVTALFSGKVPQAMEFLKPSSTFTNSVDSLRDFIIALDKEKADKLSYKVEEDVVKIRITPYKTIITKDDLSFSQGDLNVDAVIVLGVSTQADLDVAMSSHGKVLHDASIISINTKTKGSLGSIDWFDDSASSVSELLVGLVAQLGDDLLDEQSSTALLTGIVAETNRFSNEKTSPQVMTISAQLMAAGASQQLVATNLRQEGMISESIRNKKPTDSDGGEVVLSHGTKNDTKKPIETSKNQPSIKLTPKNFESSKVNAPEKNNTQASEKSKPIFQKNEKIVVPLDTPKTKEPVVEEEPLGDTSKAEQVAPVEPEVLPELPKIHDTKVSPDESGSIEGGIPVVEPVSSSNTPAISSFGSSPITEPPTFGGALNSTDPQAGEATQSNGNEAPVSLEHQTINHDQSQAVDDARKALEDALGSSSETDTAQVPVIGDTFGTVNVPPESGSSINTNNMKPDAALPVVPPIQQVPVNSVSSQAMPAMPTFGSEQPGSLSSGPSLPPLPPMPQQLPTPAPTNFMPSSTPSTAVDLPPLPPMPTIPGQGVGAPMPAAPQIAPDFVANMGTAEHGSEFDQTILEANQQRLANREDKLQEISQQYDAAVAKNQEIQAQSSNNDHSTFPLPPQ
jgi:nanoRNase/pAp phosphatase (c-di-AMP/oligoRNAs hydrolase)